MSRQNGVPSTTCPVPVPEGSPFPIQNIPFGIFSTQVCHDDDFACESANLVKYLHPRGGTIIGSHVVDLALLEQRGLFSEILQSEDTDIFAQVSHADANDTLSPRVFTLTCECMSPSVNIECFR